MPFGQEPVEWLPFDTVDYNYYLMDRDEVKNMTEYRQRNFAFFTPYLEYITGFDVLTGTKPEEGRKRLPSEYKLLTACQPTVCLTLRPTTLKYIYLFFTILNHLKWLI